MRCQAPGTAPGTCRDLAYVPPGPEVGRFWADAWSPSPEVSLDTVKKVFMENLIPLKRLIFYRWRWHTEYTVLCHSSRRTFVDESWTMIKDAKDPTSRDTSLRGCHKDSRHWKFECRREYAEVAQALGQAMRLWHQRAGADTPFQVSFVTKKNIARNTWTLPHSKAIE